ncbi:hypothetical protein SDC9_124431 [bioreactor metagenome]|uniref:Uncharacterized protein n=1 Tax=bioreactor metagenome TaxID=1076179 RepID=A0A645CKK1_9ZZZZ
MPPGIAVERRNPDQPVDAALGLQITVGEFTGHFERHALDSGFIAGLKIDDFILPAAALEIAPVHAHQHRRPVARFGAAGPGVNAEISVVVIEFAGEETDQLQLIEFPAELFDHAGNFLEHLFIALGQLDQFVEFADFALDFFVGFGHIPAGAQRRHRRLGRFLAFPEIRCGHLLLQCGHFLVPLVDFQEFPQMRHPVGGGGGEFPQFFHGHYHKIQSPVYLAKKRATASFQ